MNASYTSDEYIILPKSTVIPTFQINILKDFCFKGA